MSYQIQIRRDTIANWNSVNPILAQGEMGFEGTTKLKVGNGVDPWSVLPYFFDTTGSVTSSRNIFTSGSLVGGGDLSADRTLSLQNDVLYPGNNYFYGTDSVGAKGYHLATSLLPAVSANSFLGNNTGSPAAQMSLTATQATAMLNVFTSSLKGLAPASGGDVSNFLRADGTWAVPVDLTVPGGTNKQIQYNNSGVFGGAVGMEWDSATSVATITGMKLFVDGSKCVIERVATNGSVELRGDSAENISAYFQAFSNTVSGAGSGQAEMFFYRAGTPFHYPYAQNCALFGGYNATTNWLGWMHAASDNTVQINCDHDTSLSGDLWGQFGWGRNLRSPLSANTAVNHALAIKGYSGMAKAMAIMPTVRATANGDRLIGLDVQPRWIDGSYTGVQHYGVLSAATNNGMNCLNPSAELEVGGSLVVRGTDGIELVTHGSFDAGLAGWTATGTGWASHTGGATDEFNSAYHTGLVSGTLTHTVAPATVVGRLYRIRYRLSSIPVAYSDILGPAYTNGSLNGGSGVTLTVSGVALTTRVHEGLYEEMIVAGATPGLTVVAVYSVSVTDISIQEFNRGSVYITDTLNVGPNDLFRVNSFGNIIKLNGATTSFPASNAAGALVNNGSGTLTWTPVTTSPAGADTQVQFNNAGVFGANSMFAWDNANASLLLGTPTPATSSARLVITGVGISTAPDQTAGAIQTSTTVTKNNANVREFYGQRMNPTFNTGGSNLNTTFNVFGIDTTNTSLTGIAVNFLKFKSAGAEKFTVSLAGDITKLKGVTYAWPSANAVGQLTNDGSGNLAWSADPTVSITLTGDVTGSGTSPISTTIASGAVTLAKMANLAASSILGNNTVSPATPLALTGTQVTAMLDTFTTSVKGLVPTSVAGTSNFLRCDGAWAIPAVTAPAGSDTFVQFNDGGVFGGNGNFSFDKVSAQVTSMGDVVVGNIPVGTANARVSVYGRNLVAQTTGAVSTLFLTDFLGKNDTTTKEYNGMAFSAILNTGGANTTTSYNVFVADVNPNSVTGVTLVNFLKFSYNSVTKFTLKSDGDLSMIKSVAYSWPSANAAGQLTNNGSGALTWANPVTVITAANSITTNGGTSLTLVGDTAAPGNGYYYGTNGAGAKGYYTLPSAVPGGTNTQVQFNNSGAFGADSLFTWDNTAKSLTVGPYFDGSSTGQITHDKNGNSFASTTYGGGGANSISGQANLLALRFGGGAGNTISAFASIAAGWSISMGNAHQGFGCLAVGQTVSVNPTTGGSQAWAIGTNMSVLGDYSMALGANVTIAAANTLAWSDGSAISAVTPNTAIIYATNGVGLGVVTPLAALHNAYNGAASRPAKLCSGTWFSGGTSTSTKPHMLIEPTGTSSTNWGTAGTALGINAPNAFLGNFVDFQLEGAAGSFVKIGLKSSTAIQVKMGNAASAATGTNAFAIGPTCTASNTGTWAIGSSCTASGASSVALGFSSTASGGSSMCLSTDVATTSASWSMFFGRYGNIAASYAIGIGSALVSFAGADRSMLIGQGVDNTTRFLTAQKADMLYLGMQSVFPSITVSGGGGSSNFYTTGRVGFHNDAPQASVDIHGSLLVRGPDGVELINDGTFNNGFWTVTAGWVYTASTKTMDHSSAGAGVLTGALGSPAVIGRSYIVTYTTSNVTVGGVTVTVGGTAGTSRATNGTWTETLVATNTNNALFTPSATTARFSISAVTVEDITLTAGWTTNASTRVIDHASNGTGTMLYMLNIVAGQTYSITYTTSGFSSDGVTVSIGGTSGTLRTTNGTWTETLVAGAATSPLFTPSATTARFSVSNISVTSGGNPVVDVDNLNAPWVSTTGSGWMYDGLALRASHQNTGTVTLDYPTFIPIIGHTYKVMLQTQSVTVNGVTASLGGATGTLRSVSGHFQEIFLATTNAMLSFTPSAGGARFYLDNVSVMDMTYGMFINATGGVSVSSRNVVTAAGTTVLTNANYKTTFTGTMTQTVTLPACSIGQVQIIKNRSLGSVTINTAGSDTIDGVVAPAGLILLPGNSVTLCGDGAGTDWNID